MNLLIRKKAILLEAFILIHIIFPLFGIFLSIIITKKYSLTVLKGSLIFAYDYATKRLNKVSFYYSSYLLPIVIMRKFLSQDNSAKNKIVKIVNKIVEIKDFLINDPLIKIFLFSPFIFYLIYIVIIKKYNLVLNNNEIENIFFKILLANLLVSFIIIIKPLKFLGAPEMYMLFCIVPLSSLVSFFIISSNNFPKTECYIICISFFISIYLTYNRQKQEDEQERTNELTKIKDILSRGIEFKDLEDLELFQNGLEVIQRALIDNENFKNEKSI